MKLLILTKYSSNCQKCYKMWMSCLSILMIKYTFVYPLLQIKNYIIHFCLYQTLSTQVIIVKQYLLVSNLTKKHRLFIHLYLMYFKHLAWSMPEPFPFGTRLTPFSLRGSELAYFLFRLSGCSQTRFVVNQKLRWWKYFKLW